MKVTIYLNNPLSGHALYAKTWAMVKSQLMSGHKLVMELRSETRSDKQNRLLHSMLNNIAAQKEWAGSKRDIDTWKRLLTASWLRSRGDNVEILPALDGKGIDVVFRHTSKLTRAECAELCDYIGAWCAETGVNLEQQTYSEAA